MLCCDGFRSISRFTRALSVNPVIVPACCVASLARLSGRYQTYRDSGLFFAYHRFCNNECRTHQHVPRRIQNTRNFESRHIQAHSQSQQLNEMQRTRTRCTIKKVSSAQVNAGRHTALSRSIYVTFVIYQLRRYFPLRSSIKTGTIS